MRRRHPLLPAAVVMATTVALLAAGCGGGSPRVASITASTTAATATQNRVLAFARCMRSHGFPNWPDPNSMGVFDKHTLRQRGYSPSRILAVENGACSHLLPNFGNGPQDTAQQTRTRVADELSFARCMRSHRLTRFPDPPAHGDLSVAMVQAEGIDLHSPAVLRVVRACLPASHGALTPAKVQEALHNADA
jgi:hypothetical protein